MNLKEISLKEFLEHKTMYYDKIDYSYIEKASKELLIHIKTPFTIHIVGTNGKGSTGRFLAYYLYKKGFKTLHYSSPHIKKFNERIWLNGSDINDEELNNAHKFLQNIYSLELLEKLTYFEYTTLLAYYISKDCDYLVLEAGLGGEFDATNSVKNDLSLITTIGVDHTAFLGNTIEEIAKTKIRSVDTKMIIGYQEFNEVFEVAKIVKKELKEEFNKDIEILKVEDFNIDYEFSFATYLKRNLSLVLRALEELKVDIDFEIFNKTPLFGRCQKIVSNITIDVGHNPLAAKVILNEFKDKKLTLIYNSYADKDFKEVLTILKPIIDELFILDLKDKRVVKKDILQKCIKELKIKEIEKISLEKTKEYLVFGSFLVVEKFLDIVDYEAKY
ncbi:bifunctional folylpolyglutamate synthase/dihydrofolate synthase [Aliarcobacter thereius]|uniref:Bifunctional protein FolC n=2 Tax=Aliarcobacter thereius TaxID=544718 RepID=A0A1C0B802_9BACT|nr:Mur ligase family protein [Aliarcobacter thereius]OCL93978.1 Bifunctional protein FolC [Aliarcobacter thereius]OCL95372.1 Bifunctional protein FolC [Aliarcobacter thereius LMG 24486]OCL99735.1 Bifunctional protein FolC [Aliarcobacter thereius]QBF16639.1 bifunctional folypolyglutamate synthetase / dihydrofolate synthetase [Aliarcobacter thereius LMG 24486]TLS93636.1 bifunctional folylpolyglutamate synthase/dihydrofolate synthase [Aliarcobacter thereius]